MFGRYQKALLCLATAMIPLGSSATGKQASPPLQAGLDTASAVVECYVKKEAPVGMSFAVYGDDGIVLNNGYGWADLEQEVPAGPETRYRLASVSKLFTAGALARLAQDGRIDLDAPIRRYVPQFPQKRWSVTPRQLAAHLGGVRGYEDKDFENGSDIQSTRYPTTVDALSIFADDPLLWEPGTGYRYSTFGFTLLTAAIERASGERYIDFLRSAILVPTGATGIVADMPEAIIAHRSRFYETDETGAIVNARFIRSDFRIGGGGLLGRAEDLARYGDAMLRPGLFDESTMRDDIFAPQIRKDGRSTHVGMAWRIAQDADFGPVYHHSGSLPGGRPVLMVLPDQDIALATMSNTGNAPYDAEAFGYALAHVIVRAAPSKAVAPASRSALTFDGDETPRILTLGDSPVCDGSLDTPAFIAKDIESNGYPAPDRLNVMARYRDSDGQLSVVVASRLGLYRLDIDEARRKGAIVTLDNKFDWSFTRLDFALRES